MSRTTKFIVEVVTEDRIDGYNEKDEMAKNIADAIVSYANTAGVVPENSETFTKIVYVKEWYSGKQIIEHT